MAEETEREELERELASSRDLVHELETELAALRPLAAELRTELTALRAGLGQTAELAPDEWAGTNGSSPPAPFAGLAPPPPLPRPVIVPRLVLETAFLAAAAAVAALAELDAVWIVVVMAGAWLIVALSEWAAYAKQRRWRLDEVAPPLPEGGSPAWYVPPVERTVMRGPDEAESHTVVSALPAEQTGPGDDAVDETIVPRRRRFWHRGGAAGAPAGDPWEA
jgi:hypothetical protein